MLTYNIIITNTYNTKKNAIKPDKNNIKRFKVKMFQLVQAIKKQYTRCMYLVVVFHAGDNPDLRF